MPSEFIDASMITLDSFSSEVIPSDFINSISKLSEETNKDSYIHTDNSKIKYVDPAPYINSLQSVQDRLVVLMEECDKRKELFSKSTAKKENDHYTNILNQAPTATDLKGKFNDLLFTVEKLGSTKIDPLGEKLRKANTIKDNALNIIFLMKYYNHFYKKGEAPLELTTDRKRANTIETAKILSQLLKLSSKLAEDDSLKNAQIAKTLIFEFADSFEKEQLNSFNTYYQSKNFSRLQNIAKTLFAYNNGINIVDFFVNSHPIFSQMQDSVIEKIDMSFWKQLNDPTITNFSLDSVSAKLLEATCDTVSSEIDSITTIFQENSKFALSSLILKLFGKIIKPRLKLLTQNSLPQGRLCYLRILQLFSNGVIQMTISPLKSVLLDKNIDLTLEFEKAYNSLFNEYLKEEFYFKIEKENLDQLIDSLIQSYEIANKESLRDKKLSLAIEALKEQEEMVELQNETDNMSLTTDLTSQYETSSAKSSSAPATATSVESSIASTHRSSLYLPDSRIFRDKMKSAKKYVPSSRRIKKISGYSSFVKINEKHSIFERYKSSGNNEPTIFSNSVPNITAVNTDNKCELSLQVTQSIYKLVLEALTRTIDLVPSQMNTYAVEIFKIMLYKIGPSYIALGLESIYNIYVESQSKNKSVFSRGVNVDIDLSFLHYMYNIFLQLYLLSTVVKKSFYPLLTNENDLNLITDSFNLFYQNVEIGINIIFKETLNIIENKIDLILSKQPLNDYSTASETDRTETSKLMTSFLEKVITSAITELNYDSKLKVKFVSEISHYFLSALINHLSHLKVTMNGFTILTHDLAQYLLVFINLKVGEISEDRDYYDNEENGTITNSQISEREQLDEIQLAYKILNELPGLYTCEPESLKDFCSEGKLKDLKKSVIRDFIKNREDFQPWFLSNI